MKRCKDGDSSHLSPQTQVRSGMVMTHKLDASGIVVPGLGMTRRAVKVHPVVYSEIQGRRKSPLEVVHEASAESR